MPTTSKAQEVRAGGGDVILAASCPPCSVVVGPREQVSQDQPRDSSVSLRPWLPSSANSPAALHPDAPTFTQLLPASHMAVCVSAAGSLLPRFCTHFH